jgi:hypothetical protein
MEEIRGGQISDEEYGSAKRSLLNSLRSIGDTPSRIIEYHLTAKTSGRETRRERIMEIIAGTSKEQVAQVGERIVPGKTFLLKGTGNTHGTVAH